MGGGSAETGSGGDAGAGLELDDSDKVRASFGFDDLLPSLPPALGSDAGAGVLLQQPIHAKFNNTMKKGSDQRYNNRIHLILVWNMVNKNK